MNLLEAPSIVDDGVSSLDESQPVQALFPNPEPVDKTQSELAAQEAQHRPTPPPPTPVPQAVVQQQVPADEAEEDSDEAEEDSDESDDNASEIKPTVTTDNLNWYTDLDYCKSDINGSVETINWQFKTEMGKEMTEDDNVGMERSLLDHFTACFPPQAMSNIIALTNKKLRDDDLQEMEMGELLKFFGVLILITQFEFNSPRDLWKPVSDNNPQSCYWNDHWDGKASVRKSTCKHHIQ
jgi:Transposase IS4